MTGTWARLGLAALVILVIAVAPAPARAQGGPPLITDDPDTPGPRHWELNVSGLFEKGRRARQFEAFRLDLNYGVGERIQLKFEVPWVKGGATGQPLQTGIGRAALGIKWRFIGQEGQRLSWSVYPQVEFTTAHSSVTKGLVEDGTQVLLPTEITLEIGRAEFNVEMGRSFVRGRPGAWTYGVSTEGTVAPHLELLAELHGEHVQGGEPHELIVNVGAREKLSQRYVLLLAVGRAVSGSVEDRPRLRVYAGVQFNLPGLYKFKPPPRKGPSGAYDPRR